MKFIYLLLVILSVAACESVEEPITTNPDPNAEPTTLWFGYYQEDALNNPEDPLSGILYLNIPDNGTFEGELFFSYVGCDDGFDAGVAQGTVNGQSIQGSWEGTVDGRAVGGDYTGQLSADQTTYSGTYTNANGKLEIECDVDFTYYVAALGSWRIFRSDVDNSLDITAIVNGDDVNFSWSGINNVGIYRFVVIDRECLEEQRDLEACLVWGGESSLTDINYGQGGDVPAQRLIKGKDYIINVLAISNTGQVIASSSKGFRF